jgi:hypothetical protein
MRHKAQDIALTIGDPSYAPQGSIRVGGIGYVAGGIAITQGDLVMLFELPEHGVGRKVAPFAVCNG